MAGNPDIKLKWTVSPVPTGRYRSFEHRTWPCADYADGRIAVHLMCKEDYCGRLAKAKDGLEISVHIADWSVSGNGFKWRVLKQRAASLKQAKELALTFLTRYPEFSKKVVK